jgi:hypothetical protein
VITDESWWVEAGQAELRLRAEQLFEQMLGSRPVEAEWTQLRLYLTLLSDLRDYGVVHKREEPAPLPVPEMRRDAISSPVPDAVGETGTAALADPVTAEADTLVGTFHQGLRGGTLVTETGLTTLVVERIVAAAGFRHGDTVKAIKEGVFADGRPKYYFLKLRSADGGDNPDRIQGVGFVQHCENGHWLVRANDLEVLIPGFELRENGAAEGDVVTVAYMMPEIRDGRVRGTVVRVHESGKPDSVAAAAQPQRVRREDNSDHPDWQPSVCFAGRPRVMIVGGRNWPFYRDGIGRLGGEPVYLDAFSNDRSVGDAVAGADIVVVITSYCSHPRYDKVKAVAKDHGRLFYATSRENWSGLRSLFEQEIIPIWNAQANVAAD